MPLRHTKLAAVISALLLTLASVAGAAVLWDQSSWDNNFEGSLNLSSTSCSQLSGNTKMHTASDVHFDQPVHITTVRVYETDGNAASATQGYLWIAPKTGSMPTAASTDVNNSTNLKTVSAAYVTNGTTTVLQVTCTGLSIDLPAGDYWVSLTPKHSLGLYPYSVHLITTGPVVGDPTCVINACTTNSTWLYALDPNRPDYAIKLEGDFTGATPTRSASWGVLKTIYR